MSFDGGPPTINVTNINQNSNDGCLSGCGGIIAISVAITLLWAFVIAGWLLGTWVAVAIFGAGEGSTAAVAVGWVFEIAYLLGLLWIGVVLWRKRRQGESGESRVGNGSVPGSERDPVATAASQPGQEQEPQATMAYCFECGAQLRPGAKYCTSCGTAQ